MALSECDVFLPKAIWDAFVQETRCPKHCRLDSPNCDGEARRSKHVQRYLRRRHHLQGVEDICWRSQCVDTVGKIGHRHVEVGTRRICHRVNQRVEVHSPTPVFAEKVGRTCAQLDWPNIGTNPQGTGKIIAASVPMCRSSSGGMGTAARLAMPCHRRSISSPGSRLQQRDLKAAL